MSVLQIGDSAPDIQITNAEGKLVPLSQAVGEKGLLVFVLRGTWCAFCVDQIAGVQRNYHRYAKQGVESVFITPEDGDSVWTFRISQPKPLSFGLHADPSRETMELFVLQEHVETMPATYLLDNDLKVVWSYYGTGEEDRPGHQTIMDAIANHFGTPETA